MSPGRILAWLLCRIAPSAPKGFEERAAACEPEPVVGVTADDFILPTIEDDAAETYTALGLHDGIAFCDFMLLLYRLPCPTEAVEK